MQLLQAVLTLLVCALSNALKPHFHATSPYYTNANVNPNNFNLAALFEAQAKPVSNETHSHERRWAGQPPTPAGDDWNTAKCKGRKFMAQMSWSDFDAGQALPVPANTVESRWRYSPYFNTQLQYSPPANSQTTQTTFFHGATTSPASPPTTPTSRRADTGVSPISPDTWAYLIDVSKTADSGTRGVSRTTSPVRRVMHLSHRRISRRMWIHMALRVESVFTPYQLLYWRMKNVW
jgi:hypothetical protein